MERPVNIVARHIELSTEQRAEIEERALNLERFHARLVGCSVHVECPGDHHRKGGQYSVQLDLRVPGREPLLINRQGAEDLSVALTASFEAAQRRLHELSRRQRGDEKTREPRSGAAGA